MKLTPMIALGAALASASTSLAEEGMWLFSALPKDKIQAAYGFTPDDAWVDHVMKSSVRFNSGGSGSFVSGDGLAITNHHVGLDALQKMSSDTKNFVRDGFYAKTQADEVKCLDLELNVLVSTEDVTARVNAGVPAGATGDEAAKARRNVISGIEGESTTRQACAATSSHSTREEPTTSTVTSATPMSASSLLPSSKLPSTAAIRTTSSSPATTWISASLGSTRTTSQSTPSTTSSGR